MKEFVKIFQNKSGNEWEKKNQFKKVSKKYQLIKTEKKSNAKEYLIPFDYKNSALMKSRLDNNILKLLKKFCDVKMYQEALIKFNFGNSVPLTALDKSHLLEAKQVLSEISDLIQQVTEEMKDFKNADYNKILELKETIANKSSRYYELIPSENYTAESIPPIEHEHTLNAQIGIVNSLLDFEITTKILLGYLLFII